MFMIDHLYSYSNTFDSLEDAEAHVKNNPPTPGEKIVISEAVKAFACEEMPYTEVNIKEMKAKYLALENK